MNLEPGTIVLVTVSGSFHCAATVVKPADMADVMWLEVNTIGSHLPQMYRRNEIIELGPADIADHGLCARCSGIGKLGLDRCEFCNGSGRMADMATMATTDLACQRCHQAFTPAGGRR